MSWGDRWVFSSDGEKAVTSFDSRERELIVRSEIVNQYCPICSSWKSVMVPVLDDIDVVEVCVRIKFIEVTTNNRFLTCVSRRDTDAVDACDCRDMRWPPRNAGRRRWRSLRSGFASRKRDLREG
jgi:hypothetical protein